MIGIDTNILVRYFTFDHPSQTARAIEIMDSLTAEEPGFVSLVVVAELVWVLDSAYKLTKSEIITSLELLLRGKEVIVQEADVAWQALTTYKKSGSSYSDCLIERLGHAAGCHYTLTFDQDAARTAGMKLLR
jgi:predicted nucleic-acid-binding protein